MKVYNNMHPLPPCCVALGTFDGVHIAHRAILTDMVKYARKNNLSAAAICLLPQYPENINSPNIQAELLKALGISFLCRIDFKQYSQLSAEEFFFEIIVKKFNAYAVFCGFDFMFGNNRSGDKVLLQQLCAKAEIKIFITEEINFNKQKISSSRIRTALKEGDTEQANLMLCREYCVDFEVTQGFGIGKTLGFPTINQHFPIGYLIPKEGVYITTTLINGTALPSATGITTRPTFAGDGTVTCETTILNRHPNLYGKHIKVNFYKYISQPKKFDTPKELTDMVKDVCKQSEDFFNNKK